MKDNDSAILTSEISLPRRQPAAARSELRWGTALAGIGVLSFSMTFPATAFALRGFDPYFVAIGRGALAVVAAVVCLVATGAPVLPPWSRLGSYAVTAVCVVFGFPMLSALALDAGASVAHSAVIVGLLPLATAVCAVLRAGERPRVLFWVSCVGGALAVTVFTLSRGGGRFAVADLLLVGALVSAAVGYTEGARLARDTPGLRVISYALVVAAPVTIPVTVGLLLFGHQSFSVPAFGGFLYVGLISMFLGFVPWYAGLARGGIARAGQTQLLQPLLTLIWAWLLLSESVDAATVTAALAVLLCVAATQRTRS
ncbi:DMT family transporter [Sphaerisporangium sp. B11E5]|uniref:DMT family transporter n=1 Tax=Sphaerisporangium sp. B11E5 TaxID=3153563 RepID=UPI00325D7A50